MRGIELQSLLTESFIIQGLKSFRIQRLKPLATKSQIQLINQLAARSIIQGLKPLTTKSIIQGLKPLTTRSGVPDGTRIQGRMDSFGILNPGLKILGSPSFGLLGCSGFRLFSSPILIPNFGSPKGALKSCNPSKPKAHTPPNAIGMTDLVTRPFKRGIRPNRPFKGGIKPNPILTMGLPSLPQNHDN